MTTDLSDTALHIVLALDLFVAAWFCWLAARTLDDAEAEAEDRERQHYARVPDDAIDTDAA